MAEPLAVVEDDGRARFEMFGESFRFADDDAYEFAILEFAEMAEEVDSNSLAGAAAVMRVLKAIVYDEDRARFLKVARTNHATVERDLLPIIVRAFKEETGRPTEQPADSSDGLPATSDPSADDSYSRVIRRFEQKGRPDIAQMVDEARRSRASA